ncbi:hypothetical protein HMI56_005237 [Coelomomyces lativittatus]|nr:hypothetical protein HMI56_005237 [Coelomomyces lativittatus]
MVHVVYQIHLHHAWKKRMGFPNAKSTTQKIFKRSLYLEMASTLYTEEGILEEQLR